MYHKPKKSLGQNFLVDKNIRRKIVDNCQLQKSDIVLEIGSGNGEITELIAGRVDKIHALEIDPYLCVVLKRVLAAFKNVKIINQDILKLNPRNYFGKLTQKIKVVGNIPYYIASPIITHLLEYRDMINKIFLTTQKEFGVRLCANPGSKDYGAFSCLVQYYSKPEVLFSIKNTCFSPVPKVDSSFLCLAMLDKPCVEVKDEELFFRVIRRAFNQRRKTLKNSLKGVIPPEKLTRFFQEYYIDSRIRPENLSLADFANLANP
jgi:16S rRNA (adenine1518-N6/adenine1519-N6)-dimethyltransferase